MKKVISVISLAFLIMTLVSCQSSELSDKYDKEKLNVKVEEVINDMNTCDYDSVISIGDENLKSKITSEQLNDAWVSRSSNIGEFNDISKIVYQEKDGLAVAIAIAEYENDKVQFTLSFNENMELCGIYIK